MSSDDPDIVCFRVCENNYGADNMLWMVEMSTRSKVLLSVVRWGRKYYSANDSDRFLHCHFASIKEELGMYRHYF